MGLKWWHAGIISLLMMMMMIWLSILCLRGNPDDKIHWFSITNSIMIVFFLAGMVAMILVRALHRDISR